MKHPVYSIHTTVRPIASFLITGGGSFSGLFQCLTTGIPSGCLGETSIFKIIVTHYVFVVKAQIYMVRLLNLINSIS